MHLSKSPERNTFQKNAMIERRREEGTLESEETQESIKIYDELFERISDREKDPEWQKDNMEYDLRTTDWILAKVRENENYAQNLYAAMCNNDFIKLEVMPILKNQKWSCSWRHAGGIIADMREQGDYIDWYCSGMGGGWNGDDGSKKYVPESHVTDEIREDLKRLGWCVINDRPVDPD